MQQCTAEIETVLREIEAAMDARLYYLAFVVALTLPDICGALLSPDGRTNGAKYRSWYDANAATFFSPMTSDDCYSLRCGVVHQGRMGIASAQFSRVLFTIPNAQNNIYHRNILNDALQLDAVQFCQDMIRSVRIWFSAVSSNANVAANVPNLVQFRPLGLVPYMVGISLIA